MTAFKLAAVAIAALLALLPPIESASAAAALEVGVEPSAVNVEVGEAIDLLVTISNRSSEASPPLAAHLDITDPTSAGSVDPEDWTATLTRQIGVIDAGATETLRWPMTPISGGRFAAFVLLIPTEGDQSLTASNVVTVVVDEQRTLNPQGVLPIAAGAPLLIGLLLVGQRRRARAS